MSQALLSEFVFWGDAWKLRTRGDKQNFDIPPTNSTAYLIWRCFFLPLFFHFPPSPSLEKVLQNCLTAAMLYILSRSSSIGIMYTAPNKKYIKFTYEKKCQKLYIFKLCFVYNHERKNQWITSSFIKKNRLGHCCFHVQPPTKAVDSGWLLYFCTHYCVALSILMARL